MIQQLKKYRDKIINQKLALKENICFYARESDILSLNGNIPDEIKKIFSKLNISVVLTAIPSHPLNLIISNLSDNSLKEIIPQDTESRTFIHSIPIVNTLSDNALITALTERKGAITRDGKIITYGTIGVEQAFVMFSSICFALFVKYFSDFLEKAFSCLINENDEEFIQFQKIKSGLNFLPDTFPDLKYKQFDLEEDIYKSLEEAGKKVVELGLVDSFFGNISYTNNGIIYISQTTSSLDELSGVIDPVPLDDTSTTGLTASSELSAHIRVVEETNNNAILHGHPKFSVIMSLFCPKKSTCKGLECHKTCTYPRSIGSTPIVPGEVGTGKYGLVNTMPRALKNSKGVIVYGHGVFTASKFSFNEPLKNLLLIEKSSMERYFNLVDTYIKEKIPQIKIHIYSDIRLIKKKEYLIKAKTVKEAIFSIKPYFVNDDFLNDLFTDEVINNKYHITINEQRIYDVYYPLARGDIIVIKPVK